MPDLTNLVAFARVVEAGGFSAAARRLGVVTSVASKRVRRLEASLGIRLLVRTTRRVVPTEAGAVYYEYCRRIVGEWEQAEAAVGALKSKPSGLLRITAPSEFSSVRLAPLLAEFFRRYPEVAIELTATDRVVDLIEERIDLGLRILREPPATLAVRKLTPVRPIVCAAPGYFRRHGTPRTPADLARHNCLSIPLAISNGYWRFDRDGVEHTVPIRGSLTSISSNVLLELAVAGVGVALVPDYVAADAIAAGRVRTVLQDYYSERTLALFAVYPSGGFVAPKLRVFIDYIAERLAPQARR